MRDVIVVGGGVIGLSIAWELSGEGIGVAVVDQGEIGREASWAGAGILPPGNSEGARTPEARLRALSHARWADYSAALGEQTGIDNGYRNCGALHVDLGGAANGLRSEAAVWRDERVIVEELDADAARKCEPRLSPAVTSAFRLPEQGQVRNPWHLRALHAACAARGVEFLPGRPVVGFDRRGEKIIAVRTAGEALAAGQFCVAAGAWSKQLLAEAGCVAAVAPVRGQIVLLDARPSPVRQIIERGPRYIVPRGDGRILVGSTEEHVGFVKANTADGVAGLIAFALELVPALRAARFDRAWSGLRPGSADGLPYLGRVPGADNLFVAAGHFRSGLQMSPGTAVLLRQLMLDQSPEIPLEPYACDRHAGNLASAAESRSTAASVPRR